MTDFSMPDPQQAVIGGIGCHTDFGVVAALDPLGRVLGTESFPATRAGYRSAHAWLASFGPIAAVGVESTGSFGAALTRSLIDQGCRVIEINQPHPHLRSRRGKNDTIDAEAAARKVLSGEATAAATDTTGIVEAIRQLSVARNSAVKARAAALCQIGDLLVTAPAALRAQLGTRRTLDGKAAVCARLRPDPDRLAEAAELERRLDRLSTEASFAHLCAVAPVPASSGRTERHRLNFAGNRDANRALHMIAISLTSQTAERRTRHPCHASRMVTGEASSRQTATQSLTTVPEFRTTFRTRPALVAQGIERRFPKPCVAGSSPAEGADLKLTEVVESQGCSREEILMDDREQQRKIRQHQPGPQAPTQTCRSD